MRRALAGGAFALAIACARGDLDSVDPGERAAAIRAAAGRPGDKGLAVLVLAGRDPNVIVRRTAAEALKRRTEPGAADALGALLLDREPEVATAAARALGAFPDAARARERLVEAYADASPAARAAIADALERLGLSLRDAVEREARILWERNVAALAPGGPGRAGAAEELGASARSDAVARLVPLVDPNRNADPKLVAAAARGLAAAGDWSVRPHLEALLSEPLAEVAEAAAAALGALGDPGATEALAAAATA
ncbi:MAG TPA: HEAT repeat domain-containing protein, partial [Anaeromyxobacteraceae bacterium]|nr:HEAT repeat domain-containing protein [Anaeromyxobacteraceae bacterium]